MTIRVIITKDYDHMSEVAGEIVKEIIIQTLEEKKEFIFGLATGNSPSGMYKNLAQMANSGEIDSTRIRSFNLDEYVGLPGENPQQRMLHPESYCYFMIQEFFGLLEKKFIETSVPYGCLIDQKQLANELDAHPEDWSEWGTDAGKSISIKENPTSDYLKWIQKTILKGYAQKILDAGGIDLHIIGVGGRGHVAFHESGIPFEGSNVLLVKLDDNTVENAVTDGHFATKDDSPRYAISMGAELVYKAKAVLLLANGERKVESVTKSLLNDPTPDIPISYGQIYSKNGGNLTYVLDKIAGRELLANKEVLKKKGIEIKEV
ncbi:MAG: Glucosamine-6-phosphate deaminase 1 [Candidatus Lokiarchaeum sp. GC14_75]|nr:MAG: Glucosamine-6-phosphate deaminase 1 [Candidatus Lokiarchaeum sp. GC14_75]